MSASSYEIFIFGYYQGQLYTIEVKPTTEQRINLSVDFAVDSEKSKVLTKGFNGYQRDHQKARVTDGVTSRKCSR